MDILQIVERLGGLGLAALIVFWLFTRTLPSIQKSFEKSLAAQAHAFGDHIAQLISTFNNNVTKLIEDNKEIRKSKDTLSSMFQIETQRLRHHYANERAKDWAKIEILKPVLNNEQTSDHTNPVQSKETVRQPNPNPTNEY